jgi:large subunit ribosomal protein L9
MAKTEVILTHNIVGLGAESDQVKVSAGYARNYLFPQGFAIPLTQANKRRLEVLKQRRLEREAHELSSMTELAKSLEKLICVIKVKTGDDGKMFGAVTAGMIADELHHQFAITLDKRKIHLEHPIRALGEHQVPLHLHQDVNAALNLRVESITPIITEAPAPAEAAKPEHPKTEKRGKRRETAETAATEEKKATDKGEKKSPKTERPSKQAKEAKAPKGEKTPKAEESK